MDCPLGIAIFPFSYLLKAAKEQRMHYREPEKVGNKLPRSARFGEAGGRGGLRSRYEE